MINVMNKPMNQVEKILDPQLWHACAGGMTQVPPANSKVYYFPQGHAEHANKNVDFGNFPRIPPLIPCSVSSIEYLADSETDEVYGQIRLVPLRGNECDMDDEVGILGFVKNEEKEKSNSFAKTLTQSDANNGGGFSVPRYCAETIFPRLDYSVEPPVQTILAKDVHGEVWKFRHIYRGTPRRHLLTTGWSNFVNQKKLVAGDSIVFLRAENGDLCVGIRRAKRGIGGRSEVSSGWGVFSGFLSENGNLCIGNNKKVSGSSDLGSRERGNVGVECVVEAASLASAGRPFEVVYYPRASTPEFVVRASAVRAAMRIQWCSGMRFKMPFETEDSSRISWFMGIISSVHVDDPVHWPNSPWRLLQVSWDEPDILQNVKKVNPWLVELISNMPAIHLSHFSPPRKRSRVPQPSEFPLLPLQLFGNYTLSPSSPLCCFPDNISAGGIQGTRHPQLGLSLYEHPFKKLQTGLLPFDFKPLKNPNSDPLAFSLKIGSSNEEPKKNDEKAPMFVLFGQPILTEQQISQSCSADSLSDGEFPRFMEMGHCKVFVESEDVGRTLDSSALGSYEEMYLKLAKMFRMERSEMLSNLLYSDAKGVATKHAGDEPFCDFMKKARRMTMLSDSGSANLGK